MKLAAAAFDSAPSVLTTDVPAWLGASFGIGERFSLVHGRVRSNRGGGKSILNAVRITEVVSLQELSEFVARQTVVCGSVYSVAAGPRDDLPQQIRDLCPRSV